MNAICIQHLLLIVILGGQILSLSGNCVAQPQQSQARLAEKRFRAQEAQQTVAIEEKRGWEKAGDISDVILKIFGTIAAATWTLFTFLKERKLKPRLEPKLSGKVILSDLVKYVLINVQVKNPGFSKVDIDQKGTALLLYIVQPNSQGDDKIEWGNTPIVKTILEKHYWIEAGETVEEAVLISIPKNITAPIKLRIRINTKKITWESVTIVENVATKAI